MKRKRHPAPISPLKDEYKRYCLSEVEEEIKGVSLLDWWAAHAEKYPLLAQMARDIFSILGMSAEVERLFSSAKLIIPNARNLLKEDGIEAGECIRSWIRAMLI